MSPRALVFGAGGALGSSIHSLLSDRGFEVFTGGPSSRINDSRHFSFSYTDSPSLDELSSLPSFDAVVWAQGLNCSDSITDFESSELQSLLQANVIFVASSLAALHKACKLKAGSRLVIVSSIWQLESRPGKFSYSVSKAALQGLIKSCVLDLGSQGILINAVLPGVVDTPMTRSHLSDQQIDSIISQTALNYLAQPIDIAEAVGFLVSASNRSITGQFLTVDGGYVGLKHT